MNSDVEGETTPEALGTTEERSTEIVTTAQQTTKAATQPTEKPTTVQFVTDFIPGKLNYLYSMIRSMCFF